MEVPASLDDLHALVAHNSVDRQAYWARTCGVMFLDGTGNPHSGDPVLRRCVWEVAVLDFSDVLVPKLVCGRAGGLPRSSCANPDEEGQKSWDISVPLVGPPAVVHVCWQRVRRQIGSEGSRSSRAPRRGRRAFQSGLGLNISGAEKSGGGNGARGWAAPGSTDTTHTANHRPTTVQRSPPMNEWRPGTCSTRCRRCLQSATGGTGPGLNYRCLPVRVRGAHPSLRQPHNLPQVSPSGSRGG